MSWNDDELGAARGIVRLLIISLPLWAIVGGLVIYYW